MLCRCEITTCSEEGAVVMDTARLRLDNCVVRGNMGPGDNAFAVQGFLLHSVGVGPLPYSWAYLLT